MIRILILEANTPDIVDERRALGMATAAECFEIAFRDIGADVETQITEPYRNGFSKADLEAVDAAIFTGSGVAWSVDAPESKALRNACQMVFEAGVPVFGSCNGLQMASVLLGGTVQASPNGIETGLARAITLTDDGKGHAMMAGRTNGYCVPCIHRDEVGRLPDGASVLAGNDHSPIQAFSYLGNGVDFWGVQYHPEFTSTNIAELLQTRIDMFSTKEEQLVADLLALETDQAVAERFGTTTEAQRAATRTLELQNWLDHLSTRN
ncbi:MAG: type 1 glutamine amidotransferase [Pseudomonadota bacterium]